MHSTYTGFNPCAHNNGGCAHLCLLSFNDQRNYTCACHSGTRLHQNGHDCIGKILAGKVSIVIYYNLFLTGSVVSVAPVTQGTL